MPKFIVVFISKIMDFFLPTRVTFREEEAERAEARAARKEQCEQRQEFRFRVFEKILGQPKNDEQINEEELQELITTEQGWAEKGVKHYCTLKNPSFPQKIFGLERFYEVEVVLPKTEALAYAYVECRDSEGATVLLCIPTIKEDKVYKALNFYKGQVYELKEPETIAMVKRIFAPLFEDKAA